MNRVLLLRMRIISLAEVNSITKPISKQQRQSPTTTIFFSQSLSSTSSRLQFCSSYASSSSSPSNPPKSFDPESSSLDDIPTDVTTLELKNRIERYLGGDMEALPSIFEGILARKLSGKHDEADDELMEEFRSKTQKDDEQQFLSDEDLTDSDELSD